MAHGTVYLIVGPSGSGKEALIDAVLQTRPGIRRAPLIVSSDSSKNNCVVGAISPDSFLDLIRRGSFALQWDSDGVRYGLTHDAMKQLNEGASFILSCDTFMIERALSLFPNVQAVHITARMDVLRRRLATMKFGSDAEIDMHLAQNARLRPQGIEIMTVDTSDSIAAGARALIEVFPAA